MTDKERLEEIKQIRKNMQEYVNPDGSVEDYPKYDEQALLIVDDSHLDWLIEQAELGIHNEQALINQEQSSDKEIERLRTENKHYRDIIQDFIDYADDYNIAKAEKYRLRKTLEREEE